MAKAQGRKGSGLPQCYYEGYLERRSFKDKTSRKLWTCLCGNTLFFYNSNKDSEYVEKLALTQFTSVKNDCSQDQKLDAARFILHLKDRTFKLTAPSLEARELWKGYIHSIVELSVPTSLTLLPGQILMLNEAVEMEKERLKTPLPPEVPARCKSGSIVAADLPACYKNVSRMDAELLLEREAESGNLLLRPGGHSSTFTLTTRELLPRPVFKHYRVTEKPGEGFIIELQDPIHCATLNDVITRVLKEMGGTLTPFVSEEQYEDVLIKSNEVNREKKGEMYVNSPPPRPGASLLSDQSYEDDKIYLSERAKPKATLAPQPVLRPWAPSDAKFPRPSNSPPPQPTAPPKPAEEKKKKLTVVVKPVPRNPRVALIPPPPKWKSQSSHETEEKDKPKEAFKPVPAPRRFIPPRSCSNVDAISEELKKKFLKMSTK